MTTFAASTREIMPARRKRAWSEHPLSWPVNYSTALCLLFVLVLLPIEGAAAWSWIAAAMWMATNVAGLALIASTLEVPLAPPRPVDPDAIVQGTSLFRDSMRRLRRNQLATVSMGVLAVLILLCFGQYLCFKAGMKAREAANSAVAEHAASALVQDGQAAASPSFFDLHINHVHQDKEHSFEAPSTRHWFGTDSLGRDLFARTLYGGTISFLVAIVATCVSLVIGVSWGAIAGYLGGRVDHYMMRFVDVLYGLPFMFLVILIMSLVNGLHNTASKHRQVVQEVKELERVGKPAEARKLAQEKEITREIRVAVWLADNVNPLMTMFFALGLVSWLTMARITRGQVLSIREREFIVAAKAIGATAPRIIFIHIIPNLLGPVIVYTTLTIPGVMLSEAFLSFLGLGISEPECSWGSLASKGLAGVNVIKPYWWLIVYPAGAISLALFSLNFIGDGLRDALDPKGKRF